MMRNWDLDRGDGGPRQLAIAFYQPYVKRNVGCMFQEISPLLKENMFWEFRVSASDVTKNR